MSRGARLLLLAVAVVALACAAVRADVYMHNPRGSNNRLSEANNDRDNGNRLFDSQNNNRGGYNQGFVYFYEGSVLPIEWTMQHACGINNNTNCNVVIQWMCEDSGDEYIRDGQTTLTPTFPEPAEQDFTTGRHESGAYYANCRARSRNRGLFNSDQPVSNGVGATATRQNPGGTRRGYECPEERDYYPYWHPSPWKDIAVLVDPSDVERLCPLFRAESQNVKGKNFCSLPQFNTFATCNASGGQWLMAPPHNVPPPDCVAAPYSRDNHLGNVRGGYPATYNWTIPHNVSFDRCVLRIRYNISTGDYDGWHGGIDARFNGKNKLFTRNGYALNDNPTVDMGINFPLTLAMNTDQYGRTFQDRTHVFSVRPRPSSVPADAVIHNLNVRGKRGNIVQVYPAVEYDFVPNQLILTEGDYVHVQWTGSNTNDPNNDGQGTAGTDRSNIVEIDHMGLNYPARLERWTMWNGTDPEVYAWIKSVATLNQNNGQLNDAAPYFDGGLHQFRRGNYTYMCTRNNNFSNRSQKGNVVVRERAVVPPTPVPPNEIAQGTVIGGAVGGAVAAVLVVAGAIALVWAYKSGRLASLVGRVKGAVATPNVA